MTRRWTAGMTCTIAGLNFRTLTGRKPVREGTDLVLEWETPQGWRAVPMKAGFYIADFLTENEDVLYPPSLGLLGGRMYEQFIDLAIEAGWEAAQEALGEWQRRKRDAA